jgi:glycosyltransferase involved in cell wall biosynthesis
MTSPRTVLVVHPGAEQFGSDRMMLESVIGLVATGARVVVALPTTGPLVASLIDAGASVVVIPMLVLRKALMRPRGWGMLLRDSLRGMSAAWRLISRVRPDRIYVSTITLPQWPIIGRLRRVQTITHVHEGEASAPRLLNMVLYGPHLASDRLIFNSDFSLGTATAALPALARRSRVVYNGVAGPSDPVSPRTSLGSTLRIVYFGRLSPRKGPDVLLEAAARLRRDDVAATVTILGSAFSGYEWFEAQLRERADAEDLRGAVEFLGFRPEVWQVLAESDVVVVPSVDDEPFGNTAVEGILARRPVIASDTSGLREAAGGYSTTMLVGPGDPDALATALREVADSWDDLTAQVEAAAARARDRHAPQAYREGVCAVVAG